MPNDKTYTFDIGKITEVNTKEDIPYCKEELIFQAGVSEAARRVLRKRDDYDLIKIIRIILDAELERDDE